jgi:hypothetical protein
VNVDLGIDISRTTNTRILRISDTSVFFSLEEPENFLMEVLTPLSSKWVTYNVNPSFNLIFNAYALKIAVLQTGATPNNNLPLPDGIYSIRLSIKPNISTVVEFEHLRTRILDEAYSQALCNLYSERCIINSREFESRRSTLLGIKMDIMAAIDFVENMHDKKKGLALYEKASKDLKKFKDECKC